MKTRTQKQKELHNAEVLLGQSEAAIFVDFSNTNTADLKKLRLELRRAGDRLLVIKNRLLGLAFKDKGFALEGRAFKAPVATVFTSNLERAAGIVFKFFRGLEKEKKAGVKKIVGGYDMKQRTSLSAEEVLTLGRLPTREAALGMMLGMIAAPIKSLLYLLQEKSKRS